MTQDQAKHIERLLQLCGMPGVAAAVDPTDPAGEWRIYDRANAETRIDITVESRLALAAGTRSTPGTSTPPAVRGFVVPGVKG
ncbi:hypothetical protein [Streptomyces sp. 8N706]|uniref:hypothetical protein n=1 Tax=Streptomyces sp. 8N706 TaxID=3457416 RepID=UPI003FD081D8